MFCKPRIEVDVQTVTVQKVVYGSMDTGTSTTTEISTGTPTTEISTTRDRGSCNDPF